MGNRPPANSSSQGKSRKCAVCGHENRPGLLVCENCGASLVTGKPFVVETKTFDDDDKANNKADQLAADKAANLKATRDSAPRTDILKKDHETLREDDRPPAQRKSDEVRAVRTAGSAHFSDDMILRLEVEGAPTPILVTPTVETIMGRRDPVTGSAPDVDLTSYAGYRMGVSRRHAMLRLRSSTIDLLDLGSSNGTYINGVKLGAHQPHLVRDGDEISLGKMVLRVFFQNSKLSS